MSASTTLGELDASGVLSLGDGYRTKRSELASSGFRIIRVADVQNGYIDAKDPEFVSREYSPKIGEKRASAGDILLTTKGTVGRVAVVDSNLDDSVYSPQLCWFRVHDSSTLSPGFLRYWLQSNAFLSQASYMQSNTDMAPYISLSDLRSSRIELPPATTQQAIAEVLGALDDKIAANTILSNTAEGLAKSLLQKSCPTVSLSELVLHRRNSSSPDSVEHSLVAHFSLPAFDASRQPELVAPKDIKSNKYRVEEPSVLVSKLNPRFPRVWNVRHLPDAPPLASTEFLVLEPKFSSTSVLWAILAQSSFGHALESKVAGTSGSHQRVKPADLLSTLVIDPRQLPERMKANVDAIAAAQDSARDENQRMADLRDSLLPQLMSGKLRVKDAEKVVEGAL